MMELSRAAPDAAGLIKEGEAAATRGALERAVELFTGASARAPQSPLPMRRRCEVLAALGRKAEAISACERAKSLGGSPLEMRATVSAYLSGTTPPGVEDLARAWFYANLIHRQVPTTPLPYSAWCEIARRIGDGRLFDACLSQLERVAPEHAETRRMQALAARPPWGALGLLGVLALATLATAGHALARLRSEERRRIVTLAPPLAALLALAGTGHAAPPAPIKAAPAPTIEDHERAARAHFQAQGAGKAPAPAPEEGSLSGDVIDDANPEGSVPGPDEAGRNPLRYGYIIQDLLEKAGHATRRNDHAAAVKYYRAVVKMVPDRSVGFSKLCDAYEKAGDRKRAIEACALALSVPGVTVEDSARFVRLVLTKPGALDDADRQHVLSVIDHLGKDEPTQVASHHLRCELALRLSDGKMLETCTKALVARAPKDPKTVSFEWALALHRRDRAEARRLIETARGAGVYPDGIAEMERITERQLGPLPPWTAPTGLALAGLGLIGVVAFKRRRRDQRPAGSTV